MGGARKLHESSSEEQHRQVVTLSGNRRQQDYRQEASAIQRRERSMLGALRERSRRQLRVQRRGDIRGHPALAEDLVRNRSLQAGLRTARSYNEFIDLFRANMGGNREQLMTTPQLAQYLRHPDTPAFTRDQMRRLEDWNKIFWEEADVEEMLDNLDIQWAEHLENATLAIRERCFSLHSYSSMISHFPFFSTLRRMDDEIWPQGRDN